MTKTISLREQVAIVQAADQAHRDAYPSNEDEQQAWKAKQEARRALRAMIIDEIGVNVDQLHMLTQG